MGPIMNARQALLRWSIALAFFLSVIYLTEHFIDSRFGVWVSMYRYAHIMLFSALFLLAYYVRRLGFVLLEQSSVAATGLELGSKLVGRWLTVAILACIALRFDLSLQAYTRTLAIFLLPCDIVLDLPLISGLVYQAGFWSITIGGVAIALTIIGVALSVMLGGNKKNRNDSNLEQI